ncbi:MAG: 50S ribosomal protein L6 [Candidatus Aureabacteria bacterium]|nr:50S ribosomal protein L6 [Candidatus Auribacterota bacterium]
MSRIGKLPIVIPGGVKCNLSGQKIHIEGPRGKIERTINDGIQIKIENNAVILTRVDDTPKMKALHGLNRKLVANMVQGVTKGFSKKLIIVGTGFRANVSGKTLEMQIGYSHPVRHSIPQGIEIKVDKNVEIQVSGIDKQIVGDTAARIRNYYPPEPYKGKGIRYADEHVKRKAGKTVA